jgi:hypothetical protein
MNADPGNGRTALNRQHHLGENSTARRHDRNHGLGSRTNPEDNIDGPSDAPALMLLRTAHPNAAAMTANAAGCFDDIGLHVAAGAHLLN